MTTYLDSLKIDELRAICHILLKKTLYADKACFLFQFSSAIIYHWLMHFHYLTVFSSTTTMTITTSKPPNSHFQWKLWAKKDSTVRTAKLMSNAYVFDWGNSSFWLSTNDETGAAIAANVRARKSFASSNRFGYRLVYVIRGAIQEIPFLRLPSSRWTLRATIITVRLCPVGLKGSWQAWACYCVFRCSDKDSIIKFAYSLFLDIRHCLV